MIPTNIEVPEDVNKRIKRQVPVNVEARHYENLDILMEMAPLTSKQILSRSQSMYTFDSHKTFNL